MLSDIPPHIVNMVLRGHQSPSADNVQPWHYFWDGRKLYLTYDRKRLGGSTFSAENPATLLAMGGAIENMLEACTESPEWEMLPEFRPGVTCYAAIRNSPNLQTIPLCTIRHTNRFPYKKERIESKILDDIAQLSENTAGIKLVTKRPELDLLGKLVASASRIRFRTREVHEWLGKSLRLTQKDVNNSDGLDIRTLALPPGSAFFLRFIRDWKRMQLLNRVGGYRLLAGIEAKPITVAPAAVAITGRAGRAHALDAGRLLVRAWTYLNSRGIAVHPYYVVSDQLFRLDEGKISPKLVGEASLLKEKSRALLGLGPEDVLYMLLRIGHPTRQPPHSRRLPLDAVFTDLTTQKGSRTVP